MEPLNKAQAKELKRIIDRLLPEITNCAIENQRQMHRREDAVKWLTQYIRDLWQIQQKQKLMTNGSSTPLTETYVISASNS